MRSITLGIVFGLLVTLATLRPVWAIDLDAATAPRVLGNPDAPVTLLDFSSLGCPHCASFHMETLPQIKEAYIDTGKVKLEFRDYPLGAAAYSASMLARCLPDDRYFGFIDAVFQTQRQWAGSENPRGALAGLGRLAGLSEAEANECMTSQALFDRLRDAANAAQKDYGVESTPTFIIGEEKIVGAQDYAVFAKALDAALSGQASAPQSNSESDAQSQAAAQPLSSAVADKTDATAQTPVQEMTVLDTLKAYFRKMLSAFGLSDG